MIYHKSQPTNQPTNQPYLVIFNDSKSPGIFMEFWLILRMLWSKRSWFFLWFVILPLLLLLFATSSTRVWMTAHLLKYPGLFSVFWLILTMLQFGWSLFVSDIYLVWAFYQAYGDRSERTKCYYYLHHLHVP